jgi:MerR family transcriptional regulator, copper efflux regulator
MEQLFRISQVAKQAGKTKRTLRFYEELGILMPRHRTDSGYRMYGEEVLMQIKWIDKLHEMGFSLPEIQKFLQSFQSIGSGPDLMGVLRDFYQGQLAETKTSILRLQNLASELEESIQYMDVCGQCDTKTAASECKSCDKHSEKVSPVLISVVTNSV